MMNISNLTLEEQERIAYVTGNLEVAKLLGKVLDAEEELMAYKWENDYYD